MATVQTPETTATAPQSFFGGLANTFGDAASAAREQLSQAQIYARAATGDPNAMAELAQDMTLPEFLTSIKTFKPEYAGVTDVLSNNAQLGVAFQNAFVRNEAFRTRLLAQPEGGNNLLSVENLESILTNEKFGGQAQTLMTRMLDKVASGEMSVAQVEQVAGAGVNMMSVMDNEEATEEQRAQAQQGFFQTLEQNGLPTGQIKGEQIFSYLRQVMNGDPKGAATNLVNSLGLSGEQGAAIQELLTMAGGFVQFLGQPYMDFFNKWGPSIGGGASSMFTRLTGGADAEFAAGQAQLTPAQRAQNEISAEANRPGAMQNNSTGSEPAVNGVGEGANPDGNLSNTQRDAANNNTPETPETLDPALAGQQLNQTRSLGMGVGGP